MYADGGRKSVVGEALAGRRDEAFGVSTCVERWRPEDIAACEESLRRLENRLSPISST